MKKEVKVRAHDRADGSHVRQHSRTIESAAPYQDELPPEGLEEPNFQPGQPAASASSKPDRSARKEDHKEG